ncbi:MAG: UDP-N-acetylmuramate:L-alanyl-gamma-D-glutamyl-meso-diaminopimelate ligase [Gammaproteobacteria bacterium]|nr:MAG: UDP-N-acetylmuramate:L-alanyl-gamma-D-glutamyl-meso-diaminopimelate ligase [Gammaproteobacteria bacterium]
MRIHILGICGTFMGGLALLAREAGHVVEGSDRQAYPPMSTLLDEQGIRVHEGYDPAVLEPAPDKVLVGNALSRGNPAVEYLLDADLDYDSGPGWLGRTLLRGRHVLAVAGTHGKTTTASLLAWILERAGLAPGFLIGGVPANFGISARLGAGTHFVIEADEYDTAFFDKRSKFLHYRPRTLVLNNLEYDHADIFPDLAAIQAQFHHLVRIVPRRGRILAAAGDPHLAAVLDRGCWTPVETFAAGDPSAAWQAEPRSADGSRFAVRYRGRLLGEVHWGLLGGHNVHNALAAVAAAAAVGVDPREALAALADFRGVKRRLELRGRVAGVEVFDDFAHHPTAIRTTLEGLRHRLEAQGAGGRLVVVLEPRSNSMRMGVHRAALAAAVEPADRVWFYRPKDLEWDLEAVAGAARPPASVYDDLDTLVAAVAAEARPGDRIVIMSNGAFGGIHERLLTALDRGGVS